MGKVFIIGAGPGDPELLTVKAARLLASADVVLHDALVSPAVLGLISRCANVFDVGKRCGRKLLTQGEINSLLVSYAGSEETVVRLKGGDPSVFGRLGEEVEALIDADVCFEVIPGITAALASAAAAGISLTDRRFASSVTFLTAHCQPGQISEWRKLAATGSTLAIYMPGRDSEFVGSNLVAAGMPPDTPCVVVSSASRTDQEIRWTTLRALSSAEDLSPPSLVVVGECARGLADSRCLQMYVENTTLKQKSSEAKV